MTAPMTANQHNATVSTDSGVQSSPSPSEIDAKFVRVCVLYEAGNEVFKAHQMQRSKDYLASLRRKRNAESTPSSHACSQCLT